MATGARDQWEREAIGQRTRDALRHKRSIGLHLEPDTAEQGVVAKIRRLRNDGQALHNTATVLNGQAKDTHDSSPADGLGQQEHAHAHQTDVDVDQKGISPQALIHNSAKEYGWDRGRQG